MSTVLLTRPIKSSLAMKTALGQIGVDAWIEPLLKISSVDHDADAYLHSNALIVTSMHASRQVVACQSMDKNIAVFAVGKATADVFRQSGFGNVYEAQGEATSLLQLILQTRKPSDGLITYVSGQYITEDLAESLGLLGYFSKRVIVYKAETSAALSQQTQQHIVEGALDAIVFMSQRTAMHFTRLCHEAALSNHLKQVTAMVISDKVANTLTKKHWQAIVVAQHPSQESVVEAIQTSLK